MVRQVKSGQVRFGANNVRRGRDAAEPRFLRSDFVSGLSGLSRLSRLSG